MERPKMNEQASVLHTESLIFVYNYSVIIKVNDILFYLSLFLLEIVGN